MFFLSRLVVFWLLLVGLVSGAPDSGRRMSESERWQPGDVVLAADGQLWRRPTQEEIDYGTQWSWVEFGYGTGCHDDDDELVRPLILLVRDGRARAGLTYLVGHTARGGQTHWGSSRER